VKGRGRFEGEPTLRDGASELGRVVVVGPLPPPYNGMTVVTETLLRSRLTSAFGVLHADTSDHRSVSNVGRLDLTNIMLAIKACATVIRTSAKRDVRLIYLPIAKNRLGFLRDAPFLLAGRVMRRAVVVHFHARAFDEFRRSQPLWMQALIRLCLGFERCHAIVLGEGLRHDFDGLIPPERVYVVANGVEDARTSRPVTSVRLSVLHLATLWSEKGVFEVLESATTVLGMFPAVRYVLAGEWYSRAEAQEAKRYIARYGLEDGVRIVGPVAGERKNQLLANSTVMVLPSHSEGHPLVLLEALSASLPVITTRVGAIPEIISDGKEGFLIDRGDVVALADRTARLVGDPELRAQMSFCARRRYERDFTADHFAERLGAIWRWIMDENRQPSVDDAASAMEATGS
jgi:glycosyltransferase involved in cell wall biosynthesis